MDMLQEAIESAWAAFGAKPPERTLAVWVNDLREIPFRFVRVALKEASRGEHRPNLGHVLMRAKEMRALSSDEPAKTYELTEQERKKSMESAIKSMLWLHYTKGWSLREIGLSGLASRYAGNLEEAYKAALEIYPREEIMAWWAAQERRMAAEDAARNKPKQEQPPGWGGL